MKTSLLPVCALTVFLMTVPNAVNAQTQMGTAFTYQGQLMDDGSSANGQYDFEFKLCDDPMAACALASTTVEDHQVDDGLFTVEIDFGSDVFNGEARWLELGVRPGGSSGADPYTTLTPRQKLTPSPHALALPGLWTQQNATSPNLIGGYSGNSVTDGVAGATISGGGESGLVNRVTAEHATVGGGKENTASRENATVGGGGGNTAGGAHATVGGGLINTAAGFCAAVGGGYDNEAAADYATITGGGRSDYGDTATRNRVLDNYGTIGGGGNNQAGRDDGYKTTATYATIGGGEANTASDHYATVGGGKGNAASGEHSTVGGGRENAANDDYATVGGGDGNTAGATHATVSGGDRNAASGPEATVAGGMFNTAGDTQATVSGGLNNRAISINATVGGGSSNTASGGCSTVAGGASNTASGDRCTVGGGEGNIASGGGFGTIGGGYGNAASGAYATVAGGRNNTASGQFDATVGGGVNNIASGQTATVSGGSGNTASGNTAMVPGGTGNNASGDYSFAAGIRAEANNAGMFVWADSNVIDFPSISEPTFTPAANQFLARTTGGAVFVSAIDGSGNSTAGVQLAPGGGSWSSLSDREAKANVQPLDGGEILKRLEKVPISTWNYKAQDTSIRHIGPMAQDFHAAFGVGEDEKFITTIDADGVALAAIQGLYEIINERDAQIERLRVEKDAQIAELATRLAALEKLVRQVDTSEGGGGR